MLALGGWGSAVLDHARWNVVLASLSVSHGIHLSDVVGLAALCAGLVLLWRAADDPEHGG